MRPEGEDLGPDAPRDGKGGQDLEGQEEGDVGQADAHALAEMGGVAGPESPALEGVFVVERGPAPPHLVPVDDVVVDEEGGLDELDRRSGLDHRGRRRPPSGPRADGDESAAEHLPRPDERPQLVQGVPPPGVDAGVGPAL